MAMVMDMATAEVVFGVNKEEVAMFPFSFYPFTYSNRFGIPLIESRSITSDGTNAIITIANNTFARLANRGILLLRVTCPIPEDAAALPIVISSNGETRPLVLAGGATATGAQITGVGVYQIFYDKAANTLQLMTVGEPAAA